MLRQIVKEIIIEVLNGKESEKVTEKVNQDINYVGKLCMVRTYSAGVHFGKVKYHKEKEVVLTDSYRVHYWDGACSLSQLSMEGSKKRDKCRIAIPVSEIYLNGAIEIIPMTEIAYENLSKEDELWKK